MTTKQLTQCKLPIWLAYSMLVYVSACVYYIIMTRNIGTPFYDRLTDEQKIKKTESANERRKIFYTGIAVSALIFCVWKPFKPCQ